MHLGFLHNRYVNSDNWGALTPFMDFHTEIFERVGQ